MDPLASKRCPQVGMQVVGNGRRARRGGPPAAAVRQPSVTARRAQQGLPRRRAVGRLRAGRARHAAIVGAGSSTLRRPVRALYVDLDNTLLGRGAALLRDGQGAFSLLGVRALEACHRAGVEVVPFSGRRRTQVAEPARLLGCPAFIFEAGCGLSLDGELIWLTGEMQPTTRSIYEQIAESGAPRLLLDRYAGRLEHHDPWHLGRDASHLFRGDVDAGEADTLLASHGQGHLRLVDNGAVHVRSPTMPEVDAPRAYHLIPGAASKVRAVARHMRARGLAREDCIAVGDSREDLAAAGAVATFWLVANGLADDPSIRAVLAQHSNARVCDEGCGAGVYEAVVRTLAAR